MTWTDSFRSVASQELRKELDDELKRKGYGKRAGKPVLKPNAVWAPLDKEGRRYGWVDAEAGGGPADAN